jgi:Protein of unknown function (DUF3768)
MSAGTESSAAAREQTARIARLNDLARRAMGVACTAVATVGFRSLSETDQSHVSELIETYDAFDEDSDPHGERDFGCVYQLGDGQWTTERPRVCDDERERVFWKFDYYDRQMEFASDDAANPAITRRVLTIMLAQEY